MPLTAKQEAFCQAVLKGASQADAYREAYGPGTKADKTIAEKASRLAGRDDIKARIAELRAPIIERAQYSVEAAMAEAERAYNIALEKGNGGAMVAAVTLRAKLHGLLVERKEIRSGPLDGISDDKLDEIIAAKAREAGMPLH